MGADRTGGSDPRRWSLPRLTASWRAIALGACEDGVTNGVSRGIDRSLVEVVGKSLSRDV